MNTMQHPSYEIQPTRSFMSTIRSLGTAGIVGGLMLLLVTVAGIATALQLLQNTQENRSSADASSAVVSLQAASSALKPNTSTNAYVTIQPGSKLVSAVDVPLKYDPQFVSISNFTVISDVLPTELIKVTDNATNGTLRFVSGISKITNNTQVGKPITENKQIASFTIMTKDKTGATNISIDGTKLQVAAYDHAANVGQAGSAIALTIATQQAVCDQTCTIDQECKNDANNLTCSSGRCRLTSNPTSQTCEAQTACAVTLTRPSNGGTIERNDSLAWEACAQAHSYELIADGNGLIYTAKPLSTKEFVFPADVKLTPGATYNWKVRACLTANCATAGEFSTASTFKLKELPTTNPAVPQLKLNFSQQGLKKAGVTIPVEMTIVYGNNQKLQKSVKFISGANGVLTTATPIILDGITLTSGATTPAKIFVSTPTSLVTNLGTVTLTGGSAATLTAGADKQVLVGDFVRGGSDTNSIKLVDIALPISKYTVISAPVTDETRLFDTNFDGVFSAADISLVMSNLSKLEYRGDDPS